MIVYKSGMHAICFNDYRTDFILIIESILNALRLRLDKLKTVTLGGKYTNIVDYSKSKTIARSAVVQGGAH